MEVNTMLVACFVLLVLLLITILIFVGHLGMFSEVEVKTGSPPFTELTVCYKFNRGPYKSCGHLFTEIYSIAPKLKTIGLFYDDPEKVESHELRYAVGGILSDGHTPEPAGLRAKVEAQGFRVITFPAIEHAVLASFPFKSTFSIVLAIWKVYPALKEYLKRLSLCAWPMIEIYDSSLIRFVAPLTRQEDFLVPEATEEPEPTSDLSEVEGRLSGPEEPEEDISTGAGEPVAGSGPTPRNSGSSASSFEDLTAAAAGDTH